MLSRIGHYCTYAENFRAGKWGQNIDLGGFAPPPQKKTLATWLLRGTKKNKRNIQWINFRASKCSSELKTRLAFYSGFISRLNSHIVQIKPTYGQVDGLERNHNIIVSHWNDHQWVRSLHFLQVQNRSNPQQHLSDIINCKPTRYHLHCWTVYCYLFEPEWKL